MEFDNERDMLALTNLQYAELLGLEHHKSWIIEQGLILIPTYMAIKYVRRIFRHWEIDFELFFQKTPELELLKHQLREIILTQQLLKVSGRGKDFELETLSSICIRNFNCTFNEYLNLHSDDLTELRLRLPRPTF